MNQIVRCADCVFWEAHGGAFVTGKCRAKAPEPRLADEYDESDEARVVWPVTDATDGCGQGERRRA